MNAQQLILNIAVNLGRLSRWAMEGKDARVTQFIEDTEYYLKRLESTPKSQKFTPTFKALKRNFKDLKSKSIDEEWAENALTWANILQHRAKLA